MPDILTVHAANHPDKPALICGDETLTYRAYDERSDLAARALHSLGLERGDRVNVMSYNSIAGSEVSAGLRKAGAVNVPVNFRLRGEELAYIVRDSGARIACAGPEFVEHLEAARPLMERQPVLVAIGESSPPAGWVRLEDAMAALPPAAASSGDEQTATGAAMIYTSGTTGHPKGAYRESGVDPASVLQIIQMFGIRNTDVHLMAGPVYHSAVGVFSVMTILVGGTVVLMPRFDAEQALALIERHRVTTTFMAPTLLQRIVDLPEATLDAYDVSSMRSVILGAAPCPFSLKQRAIEYFGEVLWEFYGATETGFNLVLRPEDQLRKPGSAGTPPDGQEILLLDDGGEPVPDGQPGELWVRNNYLASYYNKPEATERSMRDGFFSVGDVAYRDADGYYYICDRKIDMIISGGVNIYPAEVEACLHGHAAVRDVAVIGVPDEHWGESVKAVVALQPGAEATEQELVDWCRGRLADYKRPRSVDFVTELPRDQAGKLLKRKIREPYWAEAGRRI
ncbi:MAG TPA: AMP-binding protein [Candidatus Dormibacteraeota bacterium]|nr:AMP-binding protein [Candidatus Dormibacteraeota bacterium]